MIVVINKNWPQNELLSCSVRQNEPKILKLLIILQDDETAASVLQFCAVCNGYKAPRSHHCSKCGR